MCGNEKLALICTAIVFFNSSISFVMTASLKRVTFKKIAPPE